VRFDSGLLMSALTTFRQCRGLKGHPSERCCTLRSVADAGAIVVSLAFTTTGVAKAAVASAKAATRGFVRRIVTVACGRLMLVAVPSCLEVREVLDSEGTELLLRSILTYISCGICNLVWYQTNHGKALRYR
jgi:hypothetical protein